MNLVALNQTSVVVEVPLYVNGGDKKYLIESNGELLLADCGWWDNFSVISSSETYHMPYRILKRPSELNGNKNRTC